MDSSISQIFQWPPFPLLLTSLLFFFIVVRYFQKSGGQGKVLPGPKPLPIIGNLHQMTGGLPHQVLARLSKKYGHVMKLQLGQISAVIVSSPEVAKEVLKTHELSFAQRPDFYVVQIMTYDRSGMVFAPYSEYWRQIRKIYMIDLLSNKRVLSFKSIREEEVWNLVENISSSEGQTINLTKMVFNLTNHIISRATFGSKNENQKDFILALHEAILFTGGFHIADLYPSLTFLRSITGAKSKILRLHKKIDEILEAIVTKHKMKREAATKVKDQEDILDTLLDHAKDGSIKINHIKAIILELFSAGSETSGTTIDWAMVELLKNPRVMKKAQQEVREACKGKSKIEEADIKNLHYLYLVIKESFRLHPPTAIVPRIAIETCEINGYTIPADTQILINPYAIGRDPTIWNDPECFVPERFEGSPIDLKGNNFELLPFGSGRRICPAIVFAISGIELALSQLLYHFDWELADGIKPEDLDMTESFSSVTRRKSDLNVIATTRFPLQK
ncbi:Cytochrome P450 [Melia azedarach]|uniref:Cytochrome P450 n=2 Tax=Melia azedarach TaxID=155640 RepID=A0ACC1Y5P1_MELAZ|nr:Cytochrome P450 [Melia azedarach]QDZ36312.1 CYP71BQ6 [Melia azedarach]